jgi:hypothetical protein
MGPERPACRAQRRLPGAPLRVAIDRLIQPRGLCTGTDQRSPMPESTVLSCRTLGLRARWRVRRMGHAACVHQLHEDLAAFGVVRVVKWHEVRAHEATAFRSLSFDARLSQVLPALAAHRKRHLTATGLQPSRAFVLMGHCGARKPTPFAGQGRSSLWSISDGR